MADLYVNVSPRRIAVARGEFLEPGEGRLIGTGARVARQLKGLGLRRVVKASDLLRQLETTSFSDKRARNILLGWGVEPTDEPKAVLMSHVKSIQVVNGGSEVEASSQDGEPVTVPASLSVEGRREKVAELKDSHTHEELAEMFGVSASTISRDVRAIEADE